MLRTVRGRPIVERFLPQDPWSLFAPEALTPAQVEPRARRSPAWFLWRDVLLDAVALALERRRRLPAWQQRQHQDARRWIASESRGLGSFTWTCTVVGLEPTWLRKRLARLRRCKHD